MGRHAIILVDEWEGGTQLINQAFSLRLLTDGVQQFQRDVFLYYEDKKD